MPSKEPPATTITLENGMSVKLWVDYEGVAHSVWPKGKIPREIMEEFWHRPDVKAVVNPPTQKVENVK